MKNTILTVVAATMCIAATAQITEQPAGELMKNMEYCSKGMVPDYTTGQISRFDETGVVAHVVVDGRKIYIKDPITHYRKNVWMEGELSEDGTQAIFHTPQTFTTETGSDGKSVTYYLRRMVQVGQGLGVDTQATDLIFSYDGQTLTQTDGGYLSITNAEGRTTSYVEYGINIRPIGLEVQCPPAEATYSTYMMSYEADGAPQTKTVNVAFSGNEVYIANPSGAAEGWIRGTIEGDRLVCPNSQFLGADEALGYYVWLKAAEGSVEIISIPGFGEWPVNNISLTDAEAVIFSYDATTRAFSTEELFLVNAGRDKLGAQYYDIAKASFTPFEEVAAVPADPQVVSCSGIIEGYGIGLFAIDIPATDVDGHYINQENMYYNVFIDDRQLLTPDGRSDIPYNYTDGQTIRVSGTSHTFTYTEAEPVNDRIGVQVFYRVGDVVNHSNLVWYDVNAAAIDTAVAKSEAHTEYFDAMGRTSSAKAKGLVVRRTTFADGTTETRKTVNR